MRELLPRGSEVIVSAYNVPVMIEYLEAAGSCRYDCLHYPVLVADRRAVVAEVNGLGCDVGPGKFFNYGAERCPVGERAVKENLSLPIHRFVTRDGLERVADIIETRRKRESVVGEREGT